MMERAQCEGWGTARYEENLKRSDIADYDKRRFNLTSKDANYLAVLAEYFVYRQVAEVKGWSLTDPDPENWAAFVREQDYDKYLKTPDIGGVLEVRRANAPNSPLPLRIKDVETNALVVQVYVPYTQWEHGGPIVAHHNRMEILGWVDAKERWDKPSTFTPAWSKTGKSKTTMIKRPWDEFDWSVFK